VVALFVTGCARPAKEHPVGSASAEPLASSAQPPEAAAAAPAGSLPAPHDAATAGSPATPGPLGSASASAGPVRSSAYPGCGESIPPARLWDETSEAEVLDAISSAKSCAVEHGRRLLLEFVAPWCEDCREMVKLEESEVVTATMKQRFERVRINVGKWDRHEALRNSFDVHALATYIVIDPKTSKALAKTTLEPITKKGQKLSAEQWAHWLQAH